SRTQSLAALRHGGIGDLRLASSRNEGGGVKLAVRRTYLGDRLCLADVLADRLVDLHAAYALRLQVGGLHREDALDRAARELPATLPALLQADPELTLAREIDEWARSRSSSG